MLIGAMNFPGRSVAKEIHRIAEDGFDFVDLTIEPPAAWTPDGKEVGRLIGDLGSERRWTHRLVPADRVGVPGATSDRT